MAASERARCRAGRRDLAPEAQGSAPTGMPQRPMHSDAAHCCEVGVSAVTGEVRVRRIVGTFDCGRILNARLATSQSRGGIIRLGLALMEATLFDGRTGRIADPSLAAYPVPVQMGVAEIDVR